MVIEIAPIFGGIAAAIFAIAFLTVTWEKSPEGRNIMLTVVALVLTGLGDGLNLLIVEYVGWLGVITAMVGRIMIFVGAQRKRRQIKDNMEL